MPRVAGGGRPRRSGLITAVTPRSSADVENVVAWIEGTCTDEIVARAAREIRSGLAVETMLAPPPSFHPDAEALV